MGDQQEKRPIFIVGCQRSGTTLLRTMLGQHPMTLEHPSEPQFILGLYQRLGYEVRDVETAVSYLINHPTLPPTINPSTIINSYPEKSLPLSQFIQRYIQLWVGEQLQQKHPILKDPALIFHLDLITHLYPKAMIIHIIRDPRANVVSQKARWAHFTIWECAMLWKKAIQKAHTWAKENKFHYTDLTFEDLVLRSEQTLVNLCAALQIPYSNQMLDFEEKTIMFAPDAPPRPITFRRTNPSHLTKWQKSLSPEDIQLVQMCCANEMTKWHYELYQPAQTTKTIWFRIIWEKTYYHFKMMGKKIKAYGRKLKWKLGINCDK